MTEARHSMSSPVPVFPLKVQFLTLQISVFAVVVLSQDSKITCEVTSAKALKNASLTCHFPEDVSQGHKGVSVYLIREDGSTDSVLICWWLRENMECNSKPGFTFTKPVSDALAVDIPRATVSQTGIYYCQLDGYRGDQLDTCDFTITSGPKTICDAASTGLGSSASLSCYFSENVEKTKKDFTVYHTNIHGQIEAVLNCTWYQGSLTCHTARDYQFDRRLTNTATVKIPGVSASHTGTYFCQLAGAAPGDYEDCVLNFNQELATSCNIPPVKLMEPATITCNFNVDVNKTKTNFNIVHFSDQNKTGVDVLKCVWQDNDALVCEVISGFEFSRLVTDRLTVTIPRANHSHDGEYMCQLQHSVNNVTRCQLLLDSGSKSDVAVNVGVLIAIFILVLTVVGILLYRRLQVRKTRKKRSASEEHMPMLPFQVTDQTTVRYQESLSASIKTMYPDILTACYFVPSLYINRNTYTKVEVAGEKVVVMEPAPDDTLRHDQAIQHVLKCLRHLADKDKEAMFVLSQFTYDDYLASVDQQFSHHKLPMPSDLTPRDKRYENFDVLIVHRHYGVVVVVVKASACTADMGVELRDNKRVVQDLQEAVKQLDGAERMLKHLMSDLKPDTLIRKTVMLPNLSSKLLGKILSKHQDVNKTLRECTGLTELSDISGECLCADQLHSDNMVDQLQVWLQHHILGSSSDPSLRENIYKTILSRFCGAATRPLLTLPDGRRVMCTPSSLQQAVSLTGELFNGSIIHPEHHQLLTEAPPRVFLSGPPGSGKTTSLLLMGKKWLSEGHKVCVLTTWRENRTSSKLLHGMLNEFSERRSKSRAPEDLHVCSEKVKVESTSTNKDFSKAFIRSGKTELSNNLQLVFKDLDLEKNEIKKFIREILKLSTLNCVFILVDDAGPYREDQLLFKSFCEQLLAVNQDLHLWAASCFTHQIPNGWQVKHFQKTVSCPPAILREKNLLMLAKMEGFENLIKWDPDNIGVAPTEGLPVKYIYHQGHEDYSRGLPFSCGKCCLDVIMLLKASGLETHARGLSDNCRTSSTYTTRSTNLDSADTNTFTPPINPSDVLVLFEHELFKDMDFYNKTMFCITLKRSGLSIKVVNNEFSSKKACHHLWISNVTDLRGLKRKVVVFVEGRGQSHIPQELIRLRGVTSCTSQLIWVKTSQTDA